jgi:hypothetical protein
VRDNNTKMIEKCYSELSYISKIDKKTFEVSAG